MYQPTIGGAGFGSEGFSVPQTLGCGIMKLFLAGEVMTGRGINRGLYCPSSLEIHEEQSWPGRAVCARAHPLLMAPKTGSKFLFYRASLPENRFTLFRTHDRRGTAACSQNLKPINGISFKAVDGRQIAANRKHAIGSKSTASAGGSHAT
jgi:hypothetical protein